MGLATVVVACGDGKVDSDTGATDQAIYDTKVAECYWESLVPDLDLEPFSLRFVVLTQDSDAPQPDTGVVPCSASDTGWPCNHLVTLDEQFRETAGTSTPPEARGSRICLDTADELLPDMASVSSCVRFEYYNHLYRSDLDTGSMSATCRDLVAEADHQPDSGNPADNQAALLATLTDDIRGCEDDDLFSSSSTDISVLIWDNPFSPTSFHTWRDSEQQCDSVLAINKDRLPAFHGGDFEFAVNEHEMGHAFGLRHVCYSGRNDDSFDSNVMATPDQTECCCECAGSQSVDTGLGSAWRGVCVNCARVDTGLVGDKDDHGDSCINSDSGGWDQCADTGIADSCATASDLVKAGKRDIGFDEAVISYDTDQGQLQRIRAGARNHWRCACVDSIEQDNTARVKVQGEINCHPGSGRFALLYDRFVDSDADDEARFTFVPVLISGDHFGRLSWVTSAQVVDFGDYDHLFAGQAGHPFAYDSQVPDEFVETHLERFDANTSSRTWPSGLVSTAVHWASDEVDATLTAYEYPVVDLTWGCANDYMASDVFRAARPPNAYPLHLSDVHQGLDWDQQLLVRPDFDMGRLWIELRGMPGQATSVPIEQLGATDHWGWSIDYRGIQMSGWIEEVGAPVGAKLRVFIDEGSFRAETWDDVTLPDLVKLP